MLACHFSSLQVIPSERYEIDIFAYVLMDNHYHLLAGTRQANLKKVMQWFGTTYTQRFNRLHFRSGHLFQGRYKSIIIQNDTYLLQVSYYIHRNPLRAGIVRRLTGYRWSSYNANAYGLQSPQVVVDRFDIGEAPLQCCAVMSTAAQFNIVLSIIPLCLPIRNQL